MDTTLTIIYCLIDDMLRALAHPEPPQRRVSDAEVMTTALAAMRFFRGNFATARKVLREKGYVPRMLSKSPFNRRLHRLDTRFEQLFELLAQVGKHREADRATNDEIDDEAVYVIDSFPVPVCDNIRIDQCQIYPKEATEDAFRGYIASKRRFFYGLKVFWVTTSDGRPVEVFFTPGSYNDTGQLKQFNFDLPEGATVYGDKARGVYLTEDLLADGADVQLLPLRKKGSTRALPAYVEYVQHYYRKAVETAASLIERRMPKSIHAVTAAGFELKVFLFVLSFSLDGLL